MIITENTFVKMPNSIYDNLSLTNEEVTILLLTYRNFMQYKQLSLCSLRLITEDYMGYDTKNNKDILPKIKDTISILCDKEYILNIYDTHYTPIAIEDIKDKNMLFYLELKELPVDNFFMVYDSDINSICNSLKGTKLNKFNLIRYYIACCRVRNNENNFGYLTQAKMKSLIDDSRTIGKYNYILQDELQLIRYNNNYLTQEKRYETTFIGKWDEENSFNELVVSEASSRHLVYTDKVKSNIKRSEKQKLNNINKNNFNIEGACQ